MSKRRSTVVASRSASRVVYITDPAVRREVHYSPAQLAAKRREEQRMYREWTVRQAAIAEKDRKARRFWLGFGAVVGIGLLATIAVVVWWLWHAITVSIV